MKFLLLNQTFYPDVAATGQYLADLALALMERGHEVAVITGRRAYDEPSRIFPKKEIWRGIQIIRVGSSRFGKAAKWRRVVDFASFMALCSFRASLTSRQDVVVSLTSPPLISVLGAWVAKIHRARFIYWVMDLNPDEAIAAGWLREHSIVAKLLERLSRFSLKRASKIIVLDGFMQARVIAKGILPKKVLVLPLWSQGIQFDCAGRERFRSQHGLNGKFVVMYSGNHSPCHPMNSMLTAAKHLEGEPDIIFCFVGGGSEFRKIETLKGECNERLRNVVCLPYQARSELAASLSSADLHVVVMGEAFVGLVHPCKIYNLLSIGAPILYVGPDHSHVTEILRTAERDFSGRTMSAGSEPVFAHARQGDVSRIISEICRVREHPAESETQQRWGVSAHFSREVLLAKLVEAMESDANVTPVSGGILQVERSFR